MKSARRTTSCPRRRSPIRLPIILTVGSSQATHMRRMIRKPASHRQQSFQKLARDLSRFSTRPIFLNSGRGSADKDRQSPSESVSSQNCCRLFLARPEADRKFAIDLLDHTHGFSTRRITPHALNRLIHTLGNGYKFCRGILLHAICGIRFRRTCVSWHFRRTLAVRVVWRASISDVALRRSATDV